MTVTHRELDGTWAQCATPDACTLLFHFPNMSVAEAEALPMGMLLPLLEVFNPPDRVLEPGKLWCGDGIMSTVYHRDYDLPAIIRNDGSMEWWQHDQLHRDGDKPARVSPDGRTEWWVNGVQTFYQLPGAPSRIRPRPRKKEA